MQCLEPVAALELALHLEDIAQRLRIVCRRLDFRCLNILFDRAEGFDHENGMMSHDRAAAFADDRGMRDALGVANLHDVVNDVVAILLERIVRRAVETGARTIIIDAEPAADIEITKLVAQLRELRIITGRFAHRAFDRRDVGHLRADMEMDELEAMRRAPAP